MLELDDSDIIGEGSARVVYRYPNDKSKCVKVVMRDKLKKKRKIRGFFSNFRFLSYFDPTKSEMKTFKNFIFKKGYLAFTKIPMFYGQVETNKGVGCVFDLVGDQNLEVYLSENSYDERLQVKLRDVKNFLICNDIHFSDWRVGNFVLNWNEDKSDYNLFIVDGFEHTEFIPITKIRYFSKKKIERRYERLHNLLKKNF